VGWFPLLEMRREEGRGRFLVAAQPIPVGETVCVSPPYCRFGSLCSLAPRTHLVAPDATLQGGHVVGEADGVQPLLHREHQPAALPVQWLQRGLLLLDRVPVHPRCSCDHQAGRSHMPLMSGAGVGLRDKEMEQHAPYECSAFKRMTRTRVRPGRVVAGVDDEQTSTDPAPRNTL
jgi:hypothetical protein